VKFCAVTRSWATLLDFQGCFPDALASVANSGFATCSLASRLIWPTSWL
jgi:hypothetical protein